FHIHFNAVPANYAPTTEQQKQNLKMPNGAVPVEKKQEMPPNNNLKSDYQEGDVHEESEERDEIENNAQQGQNPENYSNQVQGDEKEEVQESEMQNKEPKSSSPDTMGPDSMEVSPMSQTSQGKMSSEEVQHQPAKIESDSSPTPQLTNGGQNGQGPAPEPVAVSEIGTVASLEMVTQPRSDDEEPANM